MSLNYNLKRVPEKYRYHPEKPNELHPITNCLIWESMRLGLGEITQANYPEWVWRAEAWSRITRGKQLRFVSDASTGSRVVKERNVTVAEIRERIGLSTNVATLTRQQFLKQLVKCLVTEMDEETGRIITSDNSLPKVQKFQFTPTGVCVPKSEVKRLGELSSKSHNKEQKPSEGPSNAVQ